MRLLLPTTSGCRPKMSGQCHHSVRMPSLSTILIMKFGWEIKNRVCSSAMHLLITTLHSSKDIPCVIGSIFPEIFFLNSLFNFPRSISSKSIQQPLDAQGKWQGFLFKFIFSRRLSALSVFFQKFPFQFSQCFLMSQKQESDGWYPRFYFEKILKKMFES